MIQYQLTWTTKSMDESGFRYAWGSYGVQNRCFSPRTQPIAIGPLYRSIYSPTGRYGKATNTNVMLKSPEWYFFSNSSPAQEFVILYPTPTMANASRPTGCDGYPSVNPNPWGSCPVVCFEPRKRLCTGPYWLMGYVRSYFLPPSWKVRAWIWTGSWANI